MKLTVVLKKKESILTCECCKILLVDDIPFNHIALQGLLKGRINFESAYDGE